jgi:hypothetical protein
LFAHYVCYARGYSTTSIHTAIDDYCWRKPILAPVQETVMISLPTNLLSWAFLAYLPIIGPRDDMEENEILAVATFPFRVAAYSLVVSLLYPASLLASMGYAIHARITKGTAADIMHSSLRTNLTAGASYCAQWVFNKPISNKTKLEENMLEVASKIGIKPEMVDIVWEKKYQDNFQKEPLSKLITMLKKAGTFAKVKW